MGIEHDTPSRDAERKFEVLLELAPDAIVVADPDGSISLVNRRTEELFGYDRSELIGQDVDLLVPDRLRDQHARHRVGFSLDPRTREMGAGLELYGRRKDGSEFPVEISLGPMLDGDRTQVTAVIRDVSERRAADARFRALLESAPDAIVLVNTAGRIALANRRTEELFGYQAGELVGIEVELLVPERFRGVHVRHRGDYVDDPRTREMGAGLELYGLRRDGREFPVEISLSPMHDQGEQLVITIVRDVSDRRAAEQERLDLAREQAAHAEAEAGRERLASILGEIDVIVWESDAHRRHFTFVSQRAEDMLGFPLARWLEEEGFWRSLVHPDDRDLAELYFGEAVGRREDYEFEYRVRSADGRLVCIRDVVRVIADGAGGVRLRGVMMDVTARRELERRLLQSQKMEAVGQLAGGVAHDFNNLLTVISGYVNLLLARTEDEPQRSQLAEIKRAAERASELTAQLLAFSRRAPSQAELVDLNELVRGVEMMLSRLIDEDIALRIETAPALPTVRADRGQLEQVLVNLVVNARDAMPAGGEIRIETYATELGAEAASDRGLPPGQHLVLAVSDTGSGMTEETKARIFEPFFTTKEQGKGTGLGLATVYGIVQQSGGHILVDSELGRGSCFSVVLPALEQPSEEEHEPQDRDPAPTVLVVEDEPALRRLARSVLEAEGYHTYEAANGRQALEFLERHQGVIELVLTDVVMPEVSGPELGVRLASLRPETRVLYMSGYADSRLLNRGISDKRTYVLRKPFTPEELAGLVATIRRTPV
ncbi:MAG: PAS domain S-box protein [Gaiellales bacterium]